MPCAKESDDERDDDDLDVEASGKRKAAARHSADAKKRKLTPDDRNEHDTMIATVFELGNEISLPKITDRQTFMKTELCYTSSATLLNHEVAYCRGQTQEPLAIPTLLSVVSDVSREVMVFKKKDKGENKLHTIAQQI